MGKLLAIAGVDIAFERARRKIKEFLLVEVSDNTIRKQTQLMGEKQAQLEAEWIRDSQDESWLQKRERRIESVPERLYGSMDGAQVPIGEEWRELKTLSWYHVAGVYGQEQHKAQEISYHSEIAPAQDFGRLLWATGVKRLADKAKELIFVCDGAVWIWKLVSHYFPDAIQIVDWYHACEYLTPIADAVFSQDPEREEWLRKVKDWLWHGQTQKVIRSLSTATLTIASLLILPSGLSPITPTINIEWTMLIIAKRDIGLVAEQSRVLASRSLLPVSRSLGLVGRSLVRLPLLRLELLGFLMAIASIPFLCLPLAV